MNLIKQPLLATLLIIFFFFIDLVTGSLFARSLFSLTLSMYCIWSTYHRLSVLLIINAILLCLLSFVWYGRFGLMLPLIILLPLIGTRIKAHLYAQWLVPMLLMLTFSIGQILATRLLLGLPLILPYTLGILSANMTLIAIFLKLFEFGRQGNRF